MDGADSPYTRAFTYDGHDNITSKTGQGAYTYDYSPGGRTHLVTGTVTSGANAYTYDAAGNFARINPRLCTMGL